MSEDKENITLKWGTLKGWSNLKQSTVDILQKWQDLGASMSAMAQRDTPEQKKLLCEAIDQLDGEVWNDWEGSTMDKEAAKKYIMEYRA